MRHLQLDLEGCDSGLRVFRPRGRAEGVVYDFWFSAFRDQFVFFLDVPFSSQVWGLGFELSTL